MKTHLAQSTDQQIPGPTEIQNSSGAQMHPPVPDYDDENDEYEHGGKPLPDQTKE